MINFAHRIKFDAKLTAHELRCGILKVLDAVVRIASIFNSVDFRFQDVSDADIGHIVVFADAKIQKWSFRVLG